MDSLVDTNVLAELARPRPNPGVLAWAAETGSITLSVVTLEELEHAFARRTSARARGWLERFVARDCRVLDVTMPVARMAGALRGQLAARRAPVTQADMLIAATAAHHGLVLVTRNVRAFAGCGVSLLNPFA